MKTIFVSAIVVASMTAGALAQSAPPSVAPAAKDNAAAGKASSGGGKRAACRAAAEGAKGQERRDQIQLCLAQARLDCTRQAIDQKVVGPQRRDFVKSCVGTKATRGGSDTMDE
jgi:hypothetical protein